GFDRSRLALHLQRCWPVVSEPGQVVGRHHHPNAHLSGVYYLNGDGSGRSGCLRLFPPGRPNELVPGLAVGHDGPIDPESAGACRWNAPWVDLAPQAGLLVLFPASVDHAVLENEDPEENRFSISFDLVLSAPRAGARGAGRGEGGAQRRASGGGTSEGGTTEGNGMDGGAPPEYLAPHPSDWLELEEGNTSR
ncbi:MAG: putative 2OG-Fe(II) oxygenase, partial [Cyanobacteriota bacterium]|nr:putative 2OG-Fe(II) oxygenase [Cyanobacteriota bacterium]